SGLQRPDRPDPRSAKPLVTASVREGGVEPPRPKAPGPKPGVSAVPPLARGSTVAVREEGQEGGLGGGRTASEARSSRGGVPDGRRREADAARHVAGAQSSVRVSSSTTSCTPSTARAAASTRAASSLLATPVTCTTPPARTSAL